MPEFIITGPDGQKYRVTGETAEGAVAAVRKMNAGSGATEPAPADIPTRPEGSNLAVAPGTTPEMAANIPEGMVFDPKTGGYFDAALQAERGGKSAGFATKFLQGMPFLGQWFDEAAGKADQALTGSSPELAQETIRQSQKQFEESNPGLATTAQIAGGITGALPAAAMLPAASAAAPAALGARVATGLAAGAGTGALEGAVSGYGAGNDGDRAASAGQTALVQGALGGLVGMAAPMVAKGVETAARAIKGSPEKAIGSALGIDPVASRAVRSALDGEDLTRAAGNLQRGGADAMLVEAGPSMQALGDAVGNTGGAASRIMREGIDQRAAGAAAKMQGVLDGALGKPSGRADLAASIRAGTARARQTAYDAAYATPIDYASPVGRRIENLLERMPAKTGAAALRKANERMAYDGLTNQQIMAQIGDDGLVRFSEMPNAMQLDYIKRAFDDIAEDGKDAITGKLSSDAAFAARIARDIRNAHGAANPAYREALRTGMDSIQSEKAVEAGYKALMPSTTREAFRNQIRGLNDAQRRAAKLGARQFIDDQMANVRAIMSRGGGGTEVGEAIGALKALSSRSSRDKMAVLLGKDAGKLAAQADELVTAFEIQAAMAQNSKTAIRQAVQGSVQQDTAPNVVQKLLEGEPLQATKRLAQLFTGVTPQSRAAREAGIYAEIATALTKTKGPDAVRALRLVDEAMKKGAVDEVQARRIAQAVTLALGGAAYQTGKQELLARTR